MIRPVTFVAMLMALSSGAWMFVVKHQAEQLDHRIGGVTSRIRAAEQRTRVLRAEWALETDPNRLARLAALFLPGLKPMVPDQLVTWAELADRLPAEGATVPHLPLPPPMPDQLPDTGSTPGPLAANSLPLPPAQPAIVARLAAARQPVAPAIRRVAIRTIRRPAPHPVVPRAWHHPIPLGQSVLAPVHAVRPMGARVMTINAQAGNAQAAPRPLAGRAPQQAAEAGRSGSVFGGYAADLAPPRPLGSTP